MLRQLQQMHCPKQAMQHDTHGRERSQQGEKLIFHTKYGRQQPQQVHQGEVPLQTAPPEMETMKIDGKLHPSTAAPEGNAGANFRTEDNCGRKGGTDWGSAEESIVAGWQSDGLAPVCLTDEPEIEIPVKSTIREANTVSPRSSLFPAPGKPDAACDDIVGGTSGRKGPEEEKLLSDFTVEYSDDVIRRTASTSSVDRPGTAVAARESVEDIQRSPAFPAPLATDTHGAGKRLATYETTTNRALYSCPMIRAALGRSGSPSENFRVAPVGVPKRETSPEGCGKWTASPRDQKKNFAKGIFDTGQSCQNRRRPETAAGLLNRSSGPEDKHHLSIFPCPSLTYPASTRPSASSPECKAATSGGTHGGRLAPLPEADGASDVSGPFPIRTELQGFSSTEVLAAERAGVVISSSNPASLSDYVSMGHTTLTRPLPPCSSESRASRDLFADTIVLPKGDEANCTRQEAFPLPLSIVPGTRSCHREKVQVCGNAADSKRAVFMVPDGGNSTNTTQGAAEMQASEKSHAKILLRSGPPHEDNTPDDNAAVYSDTTVASNTPKHRLQDPTENFTIAYPLRSLDADDNNGLGSSTVAALCGTAISVDKDTRARVLGSDTPPHMIAPSQSLPLTHSAVPPWQEVAPTEHYAEDTRSESTAQTCPEASNCEQEPKRYRKTNEQDDRTGVENADSALSALSATFPFEHATQGGTYAVERYAGSQCFSTKVDEQLLEDPTRRATPRHKQDTFPQHDKDFMSVHGSSEGSPLDRCAGSVSKDCTIHIDDNNPPLVLPPLADTDKVPQNQQLESALVLDPIPPGNQRPTSRVVEDSTRQAFEEASVSDQTAMLSLSVAPAPLCKRVRTVQERLSEQTADGTPCFPRSVASCGRSPADSCRVQGDSSSTVGKGSKQEGEGRELDERPATVQSPHQHNHETASVTMTHAHCGAAPRRYSPSSSPTAVLQQFPSAPMCDTSESNETSLLDVHSWDNDRQGPAPRLSQTSNAVAVDMRKHRQSSVHGSRHDGNAPPVYRKSRQPWSNSAGKRSNTTPSAASCTTKGTSSDQSRDAAKGDACAIKLHNKSRRTLTTPSAAGGVPRKPQWSEAEDAMLQKFFEVFHLKWAAISAHLTASFGVPRTGKQCRERWCNHVNPAVKKGGWTPYEDAYILRRQREMGNRWAAIAKELPGRTENAVKNRFISLNNCRRSKRVGDSNHTAEVPHHGSQDDGDTVHECLSRKNEEAGPDYEGTCEKDRDATVTPQMPPAYGNNNLAKSDTEDPTVQSNRQNNKEGVRTTLHDPVSFESAEGRNYVSDTSVHLECGEEKMYAVRGAAPSNLVPACVREEKEESVCGRATTAEDAKLLECSDRRNKRSMPSFRHRMQPVQCSPRDSSRGKEAPRGRRRTNTFPETLSYASAAGERPTGCITNYRDNNDSKQKDFPLQVDAPDAMGMLAAESSGNRRQPQSQVSAADTTADGKGGNQKVRHLLQFEAANIHSRSIMPAAARFEIQGGTKQRGLCVPLLHEPPKVPIVRSLADLRHPRLNNRRRGLRNISTPESSSKWLGTEPGAVCRSSQRSPRTVLPDNNIHQGPCDNCGEVCTCKIGSFPASVPSRPGTSRQPEKHCHSIKPADGAGRSSKKAVTQPTEQQTVTRPQSPTTAQLDAEKHVQISSDLRLHDSPVPVASSWSSGSANRDAPDASRLCSPRWEVPLLSTPEDAVSQESRHFERLNAEYTARNQDEDTQTREIQHCPIEHPVVPRDLERKQHSLEHEGTKTPERLRASENLAEAKLSHLYSTGRAQLRRTNHQEQGTSLQQTDPLRHVQLESLCRETCNSLGPASNQVETSSETSLHRSLYAFPPASIKQMDPRQRDSILLRTEEDAALCKRQKKHHQRVRQSPEQQERRRLALFTNDGEDFPRRAVGEYRLLQWQGCRGVERSGQEIPEGSGRPPSVVSQKRIHNFQTCKDAYANEQETQHSFNKLDIGRSIRNQAGAYSPPPDTKTFPIAVESGQDLGAKEEAPEGTDHSSEECIQPADMVGHSYLADRLHCVVPVDGVDEQLGDKLGEQPSNGLLACTPRPASKFSFGPLKRITRPEILENTCAATASVHSLQGGAMRARKLSSTKPLELRASPPASLKNLLSDELTVLESLPTGDCPSYTRGRIGRKEGYASEVNSCEDNPIGSLNQAESLLTDSGNLIAGLDLDECQNATALDCIATGTPETPPSVSPCSRQEGICFFGPPDARFGILQQQELQQPLAEISFPPKQLQQAAGVTAQAFASRGSSVVPLRPRIWSGHGGQLGGSVTEVSGATNEERQPYASLNNTLAISELSGMEAGGELYTDISTEMQGIDSNVSDAPRIAPASVPAGGDWPVASRPTADDTVTALMQGNVEDGAAGLRLNYADDESGGPVKATAAGDEFATTPTIPTAVGNMYAQASASFHQVQDTGNAHTLLQQEYNQQVVPLSLEQESPSNVADVPYGTSSPFSGQISSEVVSRMSHVKHTSGHSTSPAPNFLHEEGNCTPSTVSRRDTGTSHYGEGEYTVNKLKLCPCPDGDTAATTQPGQDSSAYFHKALQEGVESGPLFKNLSGSFQQDDAQRVFFPTISAPQNLESFFRIRIHDFLYPRSVGIHERFDRMPLDILQCEQEPDWISAANGFASPSVSAPHDELNPRKLCTTRCPTQVGASTPPLCIVASSSPAPVSHDAQNPNSAGRTGVEGARGEGNLGSYLNLHRNQQCLQESQRLQAQVKQQKSDVGLQKMLRGSHVPASESAAAGLEEQAVFENPEVEAQKLLGVEIDVPAATPKEFAFEDLAEESAVIPSLESASVLSAAGEPTFGVHTFPSFPALC